MSPADFFNPSVSFSNPAQRQGSPLAGMLSALLARADFPAAFGVGATTVPR